MKEIKWVRFAHPVLIGALLLQSSSAAAQEAQPTEALIAVTQPVYLADSESPFGVPPLPTGGATDVEMPNLSFTVDDLNAKDFDKYYYFNRADTEFATAYADISECDGYARGLASGVGTAQPVYPYAGTLAGAAGGVIGNLMAQAIFGSAEKRKARRVNMRNCMYFKGYSRHGLAKDLWQTFNFEEGFSGVKPEERERLLKQQALVAASAKPDTKGLGL